MPLSSQMHVPKLMGEDEHSIKYVCDEDVYTDDEQETRDVDGVVVTMARRKADGLMGVVSCEFKKPDYDSEKAGAWLAAQRFSLEPADLHAVKGVEIFSTGLWNGKQITDEDLDHIVSAFSLTKGKVRPFLKLGHDDEQRLLQSDGLPAAGWVENVRKVGSKLVADFVDIPKKIYQLIKNKAYRKVSCEIYNNIDINGQSYPKMLGAVALLGSDLPGVLNLNDILSFYSTGGPFTAITKFASNQAADIISLSQSKNPATSVINKDDDMTPDEYKAKLAQTETDLGAVKSLVAEKDAEIEKFKKLAEESQALVVAAAQKEKVAKIDAFVAEVTADKLCSKSMVPLVKALLGEEKETYSVDKAELSKFALVKEILKFSKEASKVNFEETTKDEKSADGPDDLNKKVEKYAADHKVSFGAAYRAVTRDVDLPAKPLASN